ncbi:MULTISPECIES: cobaltochelatase subunit CobN [Rhizobium/Agrobacterium group]|uniref:cobaltochelatase subunit CobN n=1 Tax=Rhizobium/Agrobacterium group TaxID=227290 RepID=UPI00230020FB|nr:MULTISPECIES: cobaltochelatase subunit CobN [Rhizobium/Agrobacterium group]MDA5635011.1 cobaltochelatase subunit CobN [Agrobacterium sp. ST15.16.024]MDF1890159.1 cobaltochelatase subunit CobN [Rhizobium rhizogenes]
MRLFHLLPLVLTLLVSPVAAQEPAATDRPLVRVLTNSFVLPEKFRGLKPLAAEEGVTLDSIDVEAVTSSPDEWLAGADLIVLDVPRPSDRARVEEALGTRLASSVAPVITIGGGRPAWRQIRPDDARMLLGYYAEGGRENFRNFFAAVRLWKTGGDLSALPAVEHRSETGFWHPDAPHVFQTLEAYLIWGEKRWPKAAGRVGFIVGSSAIGNMQTGFLDGLVKRAEAAGLIPVMFWFDGEDAHSLTDIARPARLDAIVNLTHLRGGQARSAEFLDLDIPVIQTVGYREGGAAAWASAASGIPARTNAVFLAGPEGWGMIDPLVLTAVENGVEVALPAQVDALMGKLVRIAALRHKPAVDKRLALLFWNYPAGEKNLGASNLNVPLSIETMVQALGGAGYDVPPLAEKEMIDAAQAMLGGLYRTVPLEDLLARDLAEVFPVADYKRWLEKLPVAKRHAFSHGGDPGRHWAVRMVEGVPSFIIPRLKRGKLVIMPQMPRGETPGAHYHDTASPPDHLYMAAYLYLREAVGADAIIHLGTHGTQEWLPGKDRGLAADDEPFLAVGDVPVFYPYIQDNVGEALQAKRRGRAVTISHQTPPFLPSGLYDELRDLHHLIHDYVQLDEGATRDGTVARIVDAAVAAGMHADLGWTEDAARAEFDAFLSKLHDHLHELARTAMPLGLHTLGKPSDPDQRLATIMQQLGHPFYDAVGAGGDELFVDDFSKLKETKPFATLHQYLREGKDRAGLEPSLQEFLTRADRLDANLATPGETEALLAGLDGRFVAPGAGGDPIRNPEVKSGKNLYAFEPDRIPTAAAFDAGAEAFNQLVTSFRKDNGGEFPRKIAFSLWSSEAIRHLGVTEAQVLHALGLRPVWDEGGRLRSLEIVPVKELGRPRVDVVVQVTSVYRDQFDGFMRLLAGAIERIAAMDEEDNPVAANSSRIAAALEQKGLPGAQAREQADLRIFSSAPGSYGTGLPHLALDSTAWDDDSALAERFLASTQFAYGARRWGEASQGGNLFAEQLRGAQAAVMSRSSNLHGVLSTDHPFEFLGGLSVAIRHLDGTAPSLYISDLRSAGATRTASLAGFLSDELRVRYLNPNWIEGMKAEGYAGTLEMLNAANNLFGWQVVDPSTVRADQWQAMFDTYVADRRDLGINAYFEAHNPSAQAQLMERMIEAIRKGYWDAPEETRRQITERWQALASDHGVAVGAEATKAFVERMAAGFGLAVAAPRGTETPMDAPANADGAPTAATSTAVAGQVLEEVQPAGETQDRWQPWLTLSIIFGLTLCGAGLQWRMNAARSNP